MVFATCLIREGIDMAEKILNIEDLSIWYRTYRGYSQVVDHIHLHVDKGRKSAWSVNPAAEKQQP